jgi:D-sedoheptulose 7-phosphate isomerase
MSKIKIELQNQLEENISAHKNILKISKDIIDIIQNIKKKLKKGGKILLCGNGGSAADAQHLAAEFIVRLRPHINRNPIPALTLAQDTSTLTACGNDYSFDDIFLRPFKAIVKKNDILICISTSGNSKNILNVLKEAKKMKIYSVGFLGKGGGKAKKMCDKPLVVNSNNTARIQECHIFLGHFILEKVEDLLLKKI